MLGFFSVVRGLMYAERGRQLRELLWYREKKTEELDKRENMTVLESQIIHSDEFAMSESAHACPECRKPMQDFSCADLGMTSCLSCKSLWVSSRALETMAKTEKDIPADHLHSRDSKYSCPECGELMREYVYSPNGNLLVDRCDVGGHGVYFERGEIRRAFELLCES